MEFRNQVADLTDVESTRSNEEDMVCFNRAIFGGDRRALDNGKNVALNAFARNIDSAAAFAFCDFINLIQENDAAVFRPVDRFRIDIILVDELRGFFLSENF